MKLQVYGDSILKMIYVDDAGRYRSLAEQYGARAEEEFGVAVENRARLGYTSGRGLQVVEQDLEAGLDCSHALLGYGGNDSDYDWDAVSRAPEQEHQAKTSIPEFLENIRRMIGKLREAGIQPLLMNLPPIHARRYLETVTARKDRIPARIRAWVGDVERIFRGQESYSDALTALAREEKLPLLDVRSAFLGRQDYDALLSTDGIHPSQAGYALLYQTLFPQLACL